MRILRQNQELEKLLYENYGYLFKENTMEKDKLLRNVDEEGVIKLAKDLCRIPSLEEEETECTRFLAKFLEKKGFEVELQEVEDGRLQVLGKLRGTGNGLALMFNGHLSTDVPGIGWEEAGLDPYKPYVKDGKIYGHGLWNMKAGIAAMVMAADAIKKSGLELKGDLLIAAVVGEIQGGTGTVYLLKKGIRADYAVNPEPTGMNIASTHVGATHFAINTIGKSYHTSAEGGVDAIEKMIKAINALRKMKFTYKPDPRLPKAPKMLIGTIICGRGRGYELRGAAFLSDFCTTVVDVRFLPNQTLESVNNDVRRVLEGLKATDPDFKYELITTPEDPFDPALPRIPFKNLRCPLYPYDIAEDAYIIQTVKENHKYVTGEEIKHVGAVMWPFNVSYAVSDAGHLGKAGIPGIDYGPGGYCFLETPPPKQPEWYVKTDDIITCTKVLALTAMDVCTRTREQK